MTEVPQSNRCEKPVSELGLREIALAVAALTGFAPHKEDLILEAASQLDRMNNLALLIGQLAPPETAPRTALEQLWIQAGNDSDESAILLDLQNMLRSHWGDWTPALREAEGFPPIEPQT